MTTALYNLIYVGPGMMLAGIVAALAFYIAHAQAPHPKAHLSLPRYLLSSLVLGVAAFVAGSMIGIAAACMPADAGNLCGLVGVFGAGPLLCGLALIVFGYLKTNRSKTR